MGEATEQSRRIRRGLRTTMLALALSLAAAFAHQKLNDPSTSEAAARQFLTRVERSARRAGFRVEHRTSEPRVGLAAERIPAGSCYVLAVAWSGRVHPSSDVRVGCTANGARIVSRRPSWSSWTIEALDGARASTRSTLLVGRIAEGFDPIAAVAAGFALDPREFVMSTPTAHSVVGDLATDLTLLRATVPARSTLAWPAAPTTLLAIDAASDLRPGRGPVAILPSSGGVLATSHDAPLVALHVQRRSSASLKRTPTERRALAVVDPGLIVRSGCFTITFRFAGVGHAPSVEAHRFGTGIATTLSTSTNSSADTVCAGDPVSIYSIDAASTHEVVVEGTVGATRPAPPSRPAFASVDSIRALLRGDGVPRDPIAALGAIGTLAPGVGTDTERLELAVEAHARLARDTDHREAMLSGLMSGCEAGSALVCALQADVVRRGYGVPVDGSLARSLFARACSLGHLPSCALATVSAAELTAPQ